MPAPVRRRGRGRRVPAARQRRASGGPPEQRVAHGDQFRWAARGARSRKVWAPDVTRQAAVRRRVRRLQARACTTRPATLREHPSRRHARAADGRDPGRAGGRRAALQRGRGPRPRREEQQSLSARRWRRPVEGEVDARHVQARSTRRPSVELRAGVLRGCGASARCSCDPVDVGPRRRRCGRTLLPTPCGSVDEPALWTGDHRAGGCRHADRRVRRPLPMINVRRRGQPAFRRASWSGESVEVGGRGGVDDRRRPGRARDRAGRRRPARGARPA